MKLTEKQKEVWLQLRVPPPLKVKLKIAAARESTTMQDFVIEAILEKLKGKEKS